MRKYFIVTVIFAVVGVAVAFVSVRSADAFTANADSIAKAATATNPIIEVKHEPAAGLEPRPQSRLARTRQAARSVRLSSGQSRVAAAACYLQSLGRQRIAVRNLTRIEAAEEPTLALFGTAMRE